MRRLGLSVFLIVFALPGAWADAPTALLPGIDGLGVGDLLGGASAPLTPDMAGTTRPDLPLRSARDAAGVHRPRPAPATGLPGIDGLDALTASAIDRRLMAALVGSHARAGDAAVLIRTLPGLAGPDQTLLPGIDGLPLLPTAGSVRPR